MQRLLKRALRLWHSANIFDSGDWKGDMNGSGSQGDGLVFVTSVDDTVQHRV
jgi:hypothetical protein